MMKPPLRVASVMYPARVVEWSKKRDQYLISPKGRWGKNWPGLWWLVFYIAKNLGMVSHHRSSADSVRICTMAIHEEAFAELIDRAMIPYLNEGYGPEDLLVLAGSPEWPGIAREMHEMVTRSYGFPSYHKEYRTERARVFDIPVIITPHIKGVMILPKSLFAQEGR